MTWWRDPWGIPRVRGRDVDEAAHLQGFVTAQDRAWQVEVERLRAQGRTAELFGAGGEVWDAFVHEVDLPGWARRAHARLSAGTRSFVDAYVEGVRAGLASTDPPPELAQLGVVPRRGASLPGSWEPWTPLAVLAVQHVLFTPFPTRLLHARWEEALGREVADLLTGSGPGGPGAAASMGGSNAFVVGGDLTATGSPFVVGDPHRLFEAPGVYHQVGIASPDFDVVGLSFVGVPGVQHFGQTESVAWSITNAMADTVDADVVDGRISLRTPASELGDLGFEALVPLLHARTVADVDAALDAWVEPVNDVVVADAEGTVLHRVAGRTPVRDAAGHWTGWVQNPRRDVAPDEVAVTANDRTRPEYDELVVRPGSGFAPPLRRDRIAELLREAIASGPVTREAALAVLTDVRQNAGEALLARVAGARPRTPAGTRLRADLIGWDRAMAAGSELAARYADVRDLLVAALAEGPVLGALAAEPAPHPLLTPWFDVPVRVASVLHDVLGDGGPVLGVDVDAVLADALDTVGSSREASQEGSPQGWGERHRFAPVHALAEFGHDATAVLPAVFGSPLGGDTDCVATTMAAPGNPWVVRGSCARHLWDVGDPSASRWAVPTGAHGVPGHRHHADQLEAWRDGTLLPVRPFTLRPVDPETDADLLHGWVVAPEAHFWGMGENTRDEVAEIYAWITAQPHLSARIVEHEGHPLGLVQTYDPFVDEIGEFYDRRPGDLGVHLLLSSDPARAGLTASLTDFLLAEVFADPQVERVVLEPDVRNARSVALLQRKGARLGPVVELDLPTGRKTAQFAFLDRPAVPGAPPRPEC